MMEPASPSLNPMLGQVWTPDNVALDMVKQALDANNAPRRILDPASGPGTFSKALGQVGVKGIALTCYDIDPRMAHATEHENGRLGFLSATYCRDYLADLSTEGSFDLVIMNPPYVRQELISADKKETYHRYLSSTLQQRIDRRSNLFVLFMLKAVVDLAPGGILCAIVYDAITQTAYGKKAMALLDRHAEQLSEHQIKTPFDNVLVDARILVYRKRTRFDDVTSQQPDETSDTLIPIEKLLAVRRGTAIPRRKLYLALPDDPFYGQSTPFFIKQTTLDGLVIKPDARAYFSGTEALLDWLKERAGNQGYALGNALVKPVRAPIAFNYYIRNAPRHLWNASDVVLADNFYTSHPIGDFPPQAAWLLLNSDAFLDRMVAAARSQGSGLLKLQLYEYKSILVPDWRWLPAVPRQVLSAAADELILSGAPYLDVRAAANRLAQEFLS